MPFKLYPPSPGRTPYYRVRGTEFGVRLNRSTETSDKRTAERFLAKWREEAKRQALAQPAGKEAITFAKAATAYMRADRSPRFLAPLIRHFGMTKLEDIDQTAIDEAAQALYPSASAPTRNRQVYSPVSAILRHAGVSLPLRRPKGAQGKPNTAVLTEEQAFALLDAGRALNPRFGALLTFLLYTGIRLSEALRLDWADVDFDRSTALARDTKNGTTFTVHMPAVAVEALKALTHRSGSVFRLTKSGRAYNLLADAEKGAGLTLPPRSAFHILRHTHGAWRRLYAGQDTSALVRTNLWKSRNAAAIYEHVDATEESRKSDLLPTPRNSKSVVRHRKK